MLIQSKPTAYFTREPHREPAAQRDFPIYNYDALSIAEVESRLDALSDDDMRKVLAHESRTKSRKRLIEELNWRLGGA